MRNYLYIPLGGNRVTTKRRLYLNLWLVFLASGLWHGASWNFVIWGAYHGLFLVMERAFLLKVYEKIGKIGKIPSMLITFFFVVIGWIFFRVEKLADAFTFLKKLFAFSSTDVARNVSTNITIDSEFYFYLILAIIFSFITYLKIGKKWQDSIYFNAYNSKKHILIFTLTLLLIILSVSSISAFGFNPFIYFRF
jgi:alginate O-acetyltransferase complex protein AlgI